MEPFKQEAPPVLRQAPAPSPTVQAMTAPVPAGAQTIVFQDWPANIYVSYADGAGVYGLEVLDSGSRHLRSLCEKKVVGQKDDWVEWDGRDDNGKDVPQGEYTVLFTKNGKLLTQLLLIREP